MKYDLVPFSAKPPFLRTLGFETWGLWHIRLAPRPAVSDRKGRAVLRWGSPPFFVEDSPLLPLDNFLHVTAAHQTLTHDSLRRIMASTSLTNQVKEDVPFVRKLLREGRAPSFLEMLLRPAYAFRRVPHISCRAVANPILCCSCAYANLMRVIDHAQNPVAPGKDEIDEPDPGAGASRASGRSASRISLCC